MTKTSPRLRTYRFHYQTEKKCGTIEVRAYSYSSAIAEMKKQVKGIETFQKLD